MIRGVAIWEPYMDRQVTPPKRVTSPTWGPLPLCKEARRGHSFSTEGGSTNSMGPVARWNFTLDVTVVTGQPCCLVHSFPRVRPHTGRKLCGLLNQMQNISLRSSCTRRMQNFEFLGLKVSQQSWLLPFALFPPFFFSLVLTHFYSLARHLVDFIWWEEFEWKTFIILGLKERKGRWVMD